MRNALALILLLTSAATYAQAPSAPSIDDLINLKRVGSPAISPDGRQVAFTIRETNWDENAYETEIWIGDAATGQSRQVTNARKSSMQPAWSRDGAWLAFVSDRDGKRQLYRIALHGGEAERLTNTEDGVNAFAWSPSGNTGGVHDAGSGLRSDEGTREAVGRRQARRPGSTLHAPAPARPRAGRPRAS